MKNEQNKQKRKPYSPFAGMLKGFAAPIVLIVFAVPLLLTAALIAMGFWAADRHREAEALRRVNEGIYREAYVELTESVHDMSIALSKLMLSEAPDMLALSLDGVWRESGTITALLGRIPQAHPENIALNRLIAQTGDYARTLSASVMEGRPLTSADREQLLALCEAGERIYAELAGRFDGGNVPVSALTAEQFFAEPAGEDEDYPKLDYRGPYSDAAETRKALGVGGENVSEEEAERRAKQILALALGDEGRAEGMTAESNDLTGGSLPLYELSFSLQDGRTADIAVTEQGGQLAYFRIYGAGEPSSGGKPGDAALTEKGLAFLAALGYEDAEPTYRSNYDGSVVLSFCCTQGLGAALGDGAEPSVILMGDALRLRFDTASGEIVGADASRCLMSHTERSFAGVAPPEEAMANLSPYLEVGSSRLALIPLDDLSERLCWEFRGRFMENEYLVYMDAETGEEVRIVRILSDESGTSEG